MPRGFEAIKKAADRFNTEDFGPSVLFLKLPNDEDTAVVRFLEQGNEVYSYWYHDFTNIDKRDGWKTKLPCLDQDAAGGDCPGCEAGLPLKLEGLLNVIWRNAPYFPRDEEGKFIKDNENKVEQKGNKDQVAIWRVSKTTLNKQLAKKDAKFKGLGTLDFEIERQGVKLDTTYAIEPNDPVAGAQPLSDEDKELAADKYDLEKIANFKSKEDMTEIISSKIGTEDDNDKNDFETDDIKEFLNANPLD